MSADPWSAIASIIVGAGARNMAQTKAGADQQEANTYGNYKLSPIQGMVMQQAPAMSSGARSPTAQIMEGMGVPYQTQMNAPVVGAALKGEEAMLRNTTPASGGYMQAPTQVNSAMPTFRGSETPYYANSGLPDYLRQRGGFSL